MFIFHLAKIGRAGQQRACAKNKQSWMGYQPRCNTGIQCNYPGRGGWAFTLNSALCVCLFRFMIYLHSSMLIVEESTYSHPVTVQSMGSITLLRQYNGMLGQKLCSYVSYQPYVLANFRRFNQQLFENFIIFHQLVSDELRGMKGRVVFFPFNLGPPDNGISLQI